MTELASRSLPLCRVLMVGLLLYLEPVTGPLHAQDAGHASPQPPKAAVSDMNTLELIQQLQRRIGELEQKVKALEQGKAATEQPGAAKKPRPAPLPAGPSG